MRHHSIFAFFAAFAVLGAVAFQLRRRDDRRFNAAWRRWRGWPRRTSTRGFGR